MQAAHKFLSKHLGREKDTVGESRQIIFPYVVFHICPLSGNGILSEEPLIARAATATPCFSQQFQSFSCCKLFSFELKARIVHLDSAPLSQGNCGFRLDATETDCHFCGWRHWTQKMDPQPCPACQTSWQIELLFLEGPVLFKYATKPFVCRAMKEE